TGHTGADFVFTQRPIPHANFIHAALPEVRTVAAAFGASDVERAIVRGNRPARRNRTDVGPVAVKSRKSTIVRGGHMHPMVNRKCYRVRWPGKRWTNQEFQAPALNPDHVPAERATGGLPTAP